MFAIVHGLHGTTTVLVPLGAEPIERPSWAARFARRIVRRPETLAEFAWLVVRWSTPAAVAAWAWMMGS